MELGKTLARALNAAISCMKPVFEIYSFLYIGLFAAVATVPYMVAVAAFNSAHADLSMALDFTSLKALMVSMEEAFPKAKQVLDLDETGGLALLLCGIAIVGSAAGVLAHILRISKYGPRDDSRFELGIAATILTMEMIMVLSLMWPLLLTALLVAAVIGFRDYFRA